MHRYDPNQSPNPRVWLALGESRRIGLVKHFHKRNGGYGESLDLHSVMHSIVETQLAEDVEAVQGAFARLMEDGMGRHDVIHAIGSVLAEQIYEMVRDEKSDIDVNEEYYERLSTLTKDSWYENYEDDE